VRLVIEGGQTLAARPKTWVTENMLGRWKKEYLEIGAGLPGKDI